MRSGRIQNISGLECFVIDAQAPINVPVPTVILLHGYGANMYDLAALADYIDDSAKIRWVCPNGTLSLNFPGGYEGRAWFHLQVERFAEACQRGSFDELARSLHPGMHEAAIHIDKLMSLLKPSSSKMVLGGFSQGSIVGLFTYFNYDLAIDGLMLWSSCIVEEQLWTELLEKKKNKVPVFLSHGERDPVLPFALSRRLENLLKNHQFDVSYVGFVGGHEIPPKVVEGSQWFLKKFLKLEESER